MDRTALVVGVTGIAGYNTAQALLAEGWRVVGLSRTPRYEIPGVEHVYADVLDTGVGRQRAVDGRGDHPPVLHHLVASGHRGGQLPGQRGDAAPTPSRRWAGLPPSSTRVLVTGLKHYLGPFEAYASAPAETPFRESQDRLPFQNFYYDAGGHPVRRGRASRGSPGRCTGRTR